MQVNSLGICLVITQLFGKCWVEISKRNGSDDDHVPQDQWNEPPVGDSGPDSCQMAQAVLRCVITTGDTVGAETSVSQLALIRLQSLRGQRIIEQGEGDNECGSNSYDAFNCEVADGQY